MSFWTLTCINWLRQEQRVRTWSQAYRDDGLSVIGVHFLDAEGIIRDQHFGAGRSEQSEHAIQRLLGVQRELVAVEGVGVEAATDWNHLETRESRRHSRHPLHHRTRRCPVPRAFYSEFLGGQVVQEENPCVIDLPTHGC